MAFLFQAYAFLTALPMFQQLAVHGKEGPLRRVKRTRRQQGLINAPCF